MTERFVVPFVRHKRLVEKAFLARGYTPDEVQEWERICAEASRHGIQSHNAIKALHLDDLFGSRSGGCVPAAAVDKVDSRFRAASIWNANLKCGPAVAYAAMEECISLAEEFGVGTVAVDNAFHYLWGGGYVLEAARRGYIAYTCCTAMLAEVVPFGGGRPTMGTNPHSWAFPTTEAVGFPILMDWATSVVAMGKVQQLKREGVKLPMDVGVDKLGNPTNDPEKVVALLPFGAHKGYGLSLIDELIAGFIGGALPTFRGRNLGDNRKRSPCFYFQVVHPEALAAKDFEYGNSVSENIKRIIDDILGNGNKGCLLPGQIEASAAEKSREEDGLLFTRTEMDAFAGIATACGEDPWRKEDFKTC